MSFTNIPTKAYVVHGKGQPFKLEDVVLDGVCPNEVLVEIKYSGLCHTDIVVQEGGMPVGSYPAVLGHEGVGIIRHIGSEVEDTSLADGDLVILSFRTCRECRPCLEGRCGCCPHMTEYNFVRSRIGGGKPTSPISLLDGTPVHGQFFGQSSLSQMAIVSQQSVIKCDIEPRDLPFLAPFSCGYLTGAGTVLNVLRPAQGSSVLFLGMGAVGLAAMLAAKYLGVSELIAVDILQSKLELAHSLGATQLINTAQKLDLRKEVQRLFPAGVDYVVDTTGVTGLLQASYEVLAHDGTLALVGVPRVGSVLQIDALDMLLSCKRIVGVVEGFSDPRKLIPQLAQLFKDGMFPVNRLSKVYPAEFLDEAIADLKAGLVVKPILRWS